MRHRIRAIFIHDLAADTDILKHIKILEYTIIIILLRYIYCIIMVFEYNATKSMANLVKHGINFKDAQVLWEDPALQVIRSETLDEPRWIAIGCIGEKHWSAVFTNRGEKIRLISVRRSRQKEIALYES